MEDGNGKGKKRENRYELHTQLLGHELVPPLVSHEHGHLLLDNINLDRKK